MSAMQTSLTTRNQLRGTVKSVLSGPVMAEVVVDAVGEEFVAVVTRHSAERLRLRQGDSVTLLVKATEVMLAKGSSRLEQLTVRNQIPGTVTGVQTGAVMAEVRVDVAGEELAAAVTRHSIARLGLAQGDPVLLLIKATEVTLGK